MSSRQADTTREISVTVNDAGIAVGIYRTDVSLPLHRNGYTEDTMLQATLDAITILDKAYSQLLREDVPSVIRCIVLRAKDRLNADVKKALTGE